MQAAIIRIHGHWGHFKKPETSNNPLTHDFITKTALIGLIGAVLGIERQLMKPLFPQLSEDLRYGVALENRVWKQPWAFTLRRFDPDKARLEPTAPFAPRAFEFLREPRFTVVLVLANERSRDHFERFIDLVNSSQAYYEPVLGLHNCPAHVHLLSVGTADTTSGKFQTRGFVPRSVIKGFNVVTGGRIGFERIPSYQDADMWNPPDRYIEVIYSDVTGPIPTLISGDGNHYVLRLEGNTEEQWCLV